jgi:hypothetical protein
MALIQKPSPVALDKQIDYFQSDMFTALGFSDWESLHRVYLNPKGSGRVPEAFETEGEYREVFYNDNFAVTSFFLAAETRTVLDGLTEVEVAWIFAVNLEELYPLITTHRADEEFNNAVQLASEQYSGGDTFEIIRVENGIENVYREFIKDQITFDDMSNQYVVRFNYTVRYDQDCT